MIKFAVSGAGVSLVALLAAVQLWPDRPKHGFDPGQMDGTRNDTSVLYEATGFPNLHLPDQVILDLKQAADAPAPKAQSGRQDAQAGTYTVQPGDTLTLIALRLYGSALDRGRLLVLNPELQADPEALRVGQRLRYLDN